ncbi:type VII secretion protein EccB [Streptomyces sp. NPDC094032]|uniref:type VII secretion protein EccB n=1 Tax=Streptomyces sp. NPDC094032 TaxID=3155308 RepID=UPI00332000EF
MQSRRDQVQAHLFVMSRLEAGMLRGEPDAADLTPRRTHRGIRTGLFIALAIALVMGLYGAIRPGGASGWRKPGTLVVVKETGARYLFVGGSLRPVLNEASARLVAGERMSVAQVSANSLAGTPRGGPVGIVGAPDGLPAAGRLTRGDWLVCGTVSRTPSGGARATLAVAVGADRTGTPLTPEQGVLVVTPDGARHLLWQGRRLRIDTANGADTALGFGAVTPYPVTAVFLNALPAGPDLAPPGIAGRGTPGPALGGRATTVGQLFAGPSGEPYVLTRGGLAALDATRFDLLRGDPRTQREAYRGAAPVALPVGAADLAAHPAPAGTVPDGGLPTTPPQPVAMAAGRAVCTAVKPSGGSPRTLVTVVDAASVAGAPPVPRPGVVAGCGVADRVAVPPGGGAFVRALSGAGAAGAGYLVADDGVKYPVPSPEAAKALGYGAAVPVGVPAALLSLLPTGPGLEPALLATTGIVTSAESKEMAETAETGSAAGRCG